MRSKARNGPISVFHGEAASIEGEFSPDSIQVVVASKFCALDMTVADRSLCRTRFDSVRLGSLEVIHYRSEGMQRGTRRWEHIRQDNADHISVYLPLAMEFFIEDVDTSVKLSPDSFAFIATNRPFSLVQYHQVKEGFYSSAYVKVPAALIRQRVQCIDDLCCRPFPVMKGAGGIMRKTVESALEDGPALSPAQAARFGETLLDVIAGAAEWAAEYSGSRITPRTMSHQRVVDRAKVYIEETLSNPNIDTAVIAEHCRVSVRYLHAAFASVGESVAGYRRERRLQLCRAALCDPQLQERTITRIAGDWGFFDLSQFGRLYRSRFGCTPREQREQTCTRKELQIVQSRCGT